MKRFYCTVCKRVKRVRRLPMSTQTPNAVDVTQRQGVCDRHYTVRQTVRKVSAR